MSLWQRPQVWLVMKNVAGMIPPTFVSDEEGKKGLFGPAPSPSMRSGGSVGLTMRYCGGERAAPYPARGARRASRQAGGAPRGPEGRQEAAKPRARGSTAGHT